MIKIFFVTVMVLFFMPIGLWQLWLQFTGVGGSWPFIAFGIFWPVCLVALINKRTTSRNSQRIGF